MSETVSLVPSYVLPIAVGIALASGHVLADVGEWLFLGESSRSTADCTRRTASCRCSASCPEPGVNRAHVDPRCLAAARDAQLARLDADPLARAAQTRVGVDRLHLLGRRQVVSGAWTGQAAWPGRPLCPNYPGDELLVLPILQLGRAHAPILMRAGPERLGDHLNVVTVFDAGEESDGQPYMVSQYIAGGSVEDLNMRSATATTAYQVG